MEKKQIVDRLKEEVRAIATNPHPSEICDIWTVYGLEKAIRIIEKEGERKSEKKLQNRPAMHKKLLTFVVKCGLLNTEAKR